LHFVLQERSPPVADAPGSPLSEGGRTLRLLDPPGNHGGRPEEPPEYRGLFVRRFAA